MVRQWDSSEYHACTAGAAMKRGMKSPIYLLLDELETEGGKAFADYVGREWQRWMRRCISTHTEGGMISMRIFYGTKTLAQATAAGLGSFAVAVGYIASNLYRLSQRIAAAFPDMTDTGRANISVWITDSLAAGLQADVGRMPLAKDFPTNRSLDPSTQAYRFHVLVKWIDPNEIDPSRMEKSAVVPVDFGQRPTDREDVVQKAVDEMQKEAVTNRKYKSIAGLTAPEMEFEIIGAERAGR